MKTTEETTTEIVPFILAGEGYQLTIAAEADTRKRELLASAAAIVRVTNNDESGDAQFASRQLSALRIETEKSRKAVKDPVNRIGKLIDQTAKDFLTEIEAEEGRIKRLVGDHAAEVARQKAAAEAAERRAFEEARAAREAAERAADEAAVAREGKRSIAEIAAARQAEKDAEAARQATLAARMNASAEVTETKVADGVRFAIDFEVTDATKTLRGQPNLVDLTVRRADTLAYLKAMEGNGVDVVALGEALGLRVFKKPVVSSR